MTPAEQSFNEYKSRTDWLDIVRATDPDSPTFDAAVRDIELDHAYIAHLTHEFVSDVEAFLREEA